MRLKRMDCCLFAGDTVARIAADNRRRPSDKGQKRKKTTKKPLQLYPTAQIIIRLSPIPFLNLFFFFDIQLWRRGQIMRTQVRGDPQDPKKKSYNYNDTYIFCELCSQVQRSRASAYPLLLLPSTRHVLLTNLRLLAN